MSINQLYAMAFQMWQICQKFFGGSNTSESSIQKYKGHVASIIQAASVSSVSYAAAEVYGSYTFVLTKRTYFTFSLTQLHDLCTFEHCSDMQHDLSTFEHCSQMCNRHRHSYLTTQDIRTLLQTIMCWIMLNYFWDFLMWLFSVNLCSSSPYNCTLDSI